MPKQLECPGSAGILYTRLHHMTLPIFDHSSIIWLKLRPLFFPCLVSIIWAFRCGQKRSSSSVFSLLLCQQGSREGQCRLAFLSLVNTECGGVSRGLYFMDECANFGFLIAISFQQLIIILLLLLTPVLPSSLSVYWPLYFQKAIKTIRF